MDPLKVLILEDDQSTQNLYRKALSESVFEVRCSGNGRDGLEEYKTWKPDIILLDVYMPVMTGFTVLKEIRTNICDSTTTIIMQTTLSKKDDVVECLKLGVQGYIVKPFDYKAVAEMVLKYYAVANPQRAQEAIDFLKKQ